MKKLNTVNNKWVLFGIILPLIIFLLTMNIVYALFTASSRSLASGDQVTAAIKIGISSSTTLNGTAISSASGTITDLLPGDDITITGSIENNGNADLYFIINYQLSIQKTASTTEVLVNTCYTFNGNTLVELDGTTYTDATRLNVSGTKAFTLLNTLSTEYGNEYQGKTINYKLTALGIQVAYNTASDAADYLIANMVS